MKLKDFTMAQWPPTVLVIELDGKVIDTSEELKYPDDLPKPGIYYIPATGIHIGYFDGYNWRTDFDVRKWLTPKWGWEFKGMVLHED